MTRLLSPSINHNHESQSKPLLTKKRIIYDFGSNNGDDIPYYLRKADLVVAVEANPFLVENIKVRFADELSVGRLVIEPHVLSVDATSCSVAFYLHKTNHVLSQFSQPEDLIQFEKIMVPSVNVIDLVQRYGQPYYIKIDIEHYDAEILRALFEHNIKPPYISAESHSIMTFALLVSLGGYESFALVDGHGVAEKYKKHRIKTLSGAEIYSFPYQSAGPFGEDISDTWMTPDNFFRLLAFEGLGWKDIHATTQLTADPLDRPRARKYFYDAIKRKLKHYLQLKGRL
jgi:FkbM family methyltransferase